MEELVRRTEQILPKAVKGAFVNAQGVVIGLKVKYARAVVTASAAAAAAVGAAPIPVSDAVILMPVQIGMLGGITAVFGIEMSAQPRPGWSSVSSERVASPRSAGRWQPGF